MAAEEPDERPVPAEEPDDGDQEFWDAWHQRRIARQDPSRPHDLVAELRQRLAPGRHADPDPRLAPDPGTLGRQVLDLGFGGGADSVALADLGYDVTGLDVSPTAVRRAGELAAGRPRLRFHCGDLAAGLPFASGRFDAVYSHLALHYFDDKTTRLVFEEIRRVCRPGGLLVAAVKSTLDPLYGKGIRLDRDMYHFDGHRRHFFSVGYATSLLTGWESPSVTPYSGYFGSSGRPNQFLRLIATRPPA